MTLDEILKIVQIVFYITAGVVAVLTFISAKKGLLNTVNTEYHKRVFDKIDDLSQELLSEFDPESDNYWVKGDPLQNFFKEIHETFRKNKEQILKDKEFHSGVPSPRSFDRIQRIVLKVKSDPFVPKEIRNKVIAHLEERSQKLFSIHMDEIRKYLKELAHGKHGDDYELNSSIVHNRINDRLYKNNCGISQIEEQVHEVRLFIQGYLDKFNPLK